MSLLIIFFSHPPLSASNVTIGFVILTTVRRKELDLCYESTSNRQPVSDFLTFLCLIPESIHLLKRHILEVQAFCF